MSIHEDNEDATKYNWQQLAEQNCTPAEFLLMIVSGEAEFPDNSFLNALHKQFVEDYQATAANTNTRPISELDNATAI